mgnify:CR=1 FL=1
MNIDKTYCIYDLITPVGYIPFNYTKKELSDILKSTLDGTLKLKDKYPNYKKLLTNQLRPNLLNDNENTFLVVVKSSESSILSGVNLDNMISKQLKNYIEIFDNFKIVKS